jgi:hypothetical protein
MQRIKSLHYNSMRWINSKGESRNHDLPAYTQNGTMHWCRNGRSIRLCKIKKSQFSGIASNILPISIYYFGRHDYRYTQNDKKMFQIMYCDGERIVKNE